MPYITPPKTVNTASCNRVFGLCHATNTVYTIDDDNVVHPIKPSAQDFDQIHYLFDQWWEDPIGTEEVHVFVKDGQIEQI